MAKENGIHQWFLKCTVDGPSLLLLFNDGTWKEHLISERYADDLEIRISYALYDQYVNNCTEEQFINALRDAGFVVS